MFWRYIFPPVYGLMIYTSLRLVNDVISGTQFWKRHWSINAIEIGTTIIVSYIFLFILNHFVEKFSRKNRARLSIRTILGEFGEVYFFCALVLNATVTPMAALTDDGLQWYDVININLIPILYLMLYYAIARGNAFSKAFYDQQVQIEKIRNDQLQTELKFLKSQYHPHFLFNALNTIYFQMDENISAAKESVEKFSELLRYQLYDQQQMVPISQELNYLQNFIDLQKMRTSEQLKLNVHLDERLNGQKVYPLLFLPLVENAFKYVGGNYAINIAMYLKNARLHFEVENNIPENIEMNESSGIGLDNLKRRLELLYPGKYELMIKKENDWFSAYLNLNIEH